MARLSVRESNKCPPISSPYRIMGCKLGAKKIFTCILRHTARRCAVPLAEMEAKGIMSMNQCCMKVVMRGVDDRERRTNY